MLENMLTQSRHQHAQYARQIMDWRQDRLTSLTRAGGWLSLAGFGWLEPGANYVGSAQDNDIVLPVGPAYLGVITLSADSRTHIEFPYKDLATVNGREVSRAELFSDSNPNQKPSTVSFGSAQLVIIHRDGRKAVRVRDDGTTTRSSFSGLDYFALDPHWRITARWTPIPKACHLTIIRRLGTVSQVEVPGRASFQHEGRVHTLLPFREKPGGDLFFVFADQTSGRETYQNARFLYAKEPVRGDIVLDFNMAHNPPSAFTPYANCPIAPAVNRLELRVTAGEMRYFHPQPNA